MMKNGFALHGVMTFALILPCVSPARSAKQEFSESEIHSMASKARRLKPRTKALEAAKRASDVRDAVFIYTMAAPSADRKPPYYPLRPVPGVAWRKIDPSRFILLNFDDQAGVYAFVARAKDIPREEIKEEVKADGYRSDIRGTYVEREVWLFWEVNLKVRREVLATYKMPITNSNASAEISVVRGGVQGTVRRVPIKGTDRILSYDYTKKDYVEIPMGVWPERFRPRPFGLGTGVLRNGS